MADTATRPIDRTRKPADARGAFGRFASIPRVGYLGAQGFALLCLAACLASARGFPDGAARQVLELVLPLGLLAWAGVGMGRRALAVGVPPLVAGLAVLPPVVGILVQATGAQVLGWHASPAIWMASAATSFALGFLPARRRAFPFPWGATAMTMAIAASACAGVLASFPGIASGLPLSGIASGGAATGVLLAAALAFAFGAGEPVGERAYAQVADTEQAALSGVLVLAALGWSGFAWHSRGMSWDSLLASPASLLPAAALYALPLLSFQWLLFGRRATTKVFWGVLLVLSAVPFLDWWSKSSAFGEGITRHYASVASFPRREPSPEINVVVYDLRAPVSAVEALSPLGGMRAFEVVGGQVSELLPDGLKATVAGLPDRYFRVSSTTMPGTMPGTRAMLVEQIDYGKPLPLGVDVESRVMEPVMPPLPTARGWLLSERVLHETDARAARTPTLGAKAAAFVVAVLKGKAFVRNPLD